MKNNRLLSVSACVAALFLAACSHTGTSADNSSKDTGSTKAGAATAHSGACRLLRDIDGKGKNMVYRCNIRTVLNTPDAKAALDNKMPVSYAARIIQGSARTNATSRSFGRDNEASCERAVLNAVNNLQNSAKRNGSNRVSNLVSYVAQNDGRFDRNRVNAAGQADCIVATFQARVVMRGNVK